MGYFVPLAGSILLLWWMWQSISVFAPGEWYRPFHPFSLMSVIWQWGLLLMLLGLLNKRLMVRG